MVHITGGFLFFHAEEKWQRAKVKKSTLEDFFQNPEAFKSILI